MKKAFLLTFMALSMTAMAQQITPLTVEVIEPKLDSLRALYASEPQVYLATLNSLQKQMDANSKDLKAARSVLKQEQDHAKDVESFLKDAGKTAETMKKLYAKEEDELRDMQKTIEKQQRSLGKATELNKQTRDAYQQLLEQEQKDLGYAIREVAERKRAIADMETQLQNSKTRLQNYVNDVEQKANALDQLEAEWRTRNDQLKAELKYAKSLKK